jgi:hypothetical protein
METQLSGEKSGQCWYDLFIADGTCNIHSRAFSNNVKNDRSTTAS